MGWDWAMEGQAPGNRVIYELKKVMQKWDRNSPDCEFRFYFYNNVGADNASRHVKPQNEDEKAYDKAWTERPNSRYFPISKSMNQTLNSPMCV